MNCFLADRISRQLTGIFRGGGATFLRESIGNAVFFSTYEYVRYHMHKPLRDASSDLAQAIDVGVGIVSGGLGGIAVSVSVNCTYRKTIDTISLTEFVLSLYFLFPFFPFFFFFGAFSFLIF